METIELNNEALTTFMGYRGQGITITPEPLQVGRTSTITLALQNTGATPIVIRKIEPKIAEFGMGVPWTALPTLDGLVVPVGAVKEASLDWTPTKGGHRCIRAFIHTTRSMQPLCVGRNESVIEAAGTESHWQVPFHLGNPQDRRMPIFLMLYGVQALSAQILVQERRVEPGSPIWLERGEEASGVVLLQSQTRDAIASQVRVEAMIGEQFLDGIQVEVRRPACVLPVEAELALASRVLVA